mgnify:CR=1 FL=1
MPVVQPRHILSGMLVNEAMRRQIVQLPAAAVVAKGINHLLKFKVNALLITDADQRPAGVVSKTDLIAAFYAGLPVDTPLGDIMASPPLTCYPDDAIESALDRMRSHGVHRLYVTGAETTSMVGTLSYTDVVALLYRYCRSCPKSTSRKGGAAKPEDEEWRLHVRDVMTASVVSFPEDARIARVIDVVCEPAALPVEQVQAEVSWPLKIAPDLEPFTTPDPKWRIVDFELLYEGPPVKCGECSIVATPIGSFAIRHALKSIWCVKIDTVLRFT